MNQFRTRCSLDPNRNVRLVTSQVHPGKPCQPCILCSKGNQSKYFHPKSWKDTTLLGCLQQLEPSLRVQPESCICRPCNNEVKDIRNNQFVPRWRKQGIKNLCIIPNCIWDAQKVTKLTSKSALLAFFDKENFEDDGEYSEGVPLCAEYYGEYYRYANPHKKCQTCGKRLDASKGRPYPQPKVIRKFC